MILKINGTDYSEYIQHKVDIVETPRYIDGVNAGVSINGTAIYDRVATKYDLQVSLKPMPQDKVNQIIQLMESESVRVEYTSFLSGTTRTVVMHPISSEVHFLTVDNGRRIYGQTTLSFEEK